MFPRFSTVPQTLTDCHPFPAATQLATLQIFDPLSLVRYPPPAVSRLRTRFCSALVVPISNLVPWSVWPTRRTVCGSTFGKEQMLIGLRWNIRSRSRFCVLQKNHVLLVHKSEVVLELERGFQLESFIVVMRSRSCSKFQDFCHVRRQ